MHINDTGDLYRIYATAERDGVDFNLGFEVMSRWSGARFDASPDRSVRCDFVEIAQRRIVETRPVE